MIFIFKREFYKEQRLAKHKRKSSYNKKSFPFTGISRRHSPFVLSPLTFLSHEKEKERKAFFPLTLSDKNISVRPPLQLQQRRFVCRGVNNNGRVFTRKCHKISQTDFRGNKVAAAFVLKILALSLSFIGVREKIDKQATEGPLS